VCRSGPASFDAIERNDGNDENDENDGNERERRERFAGAGWQGRAITCE
jgi:hypothetical protein